MDMLYFQMYVTLMPIYAILSLTVNFLKFILRFP